MTTQLCGILLHPAGHTLSPILHRSAYDELGLDAVYLPFDVPADALPAAVSGMRALGIRQLSISIPHKQAVLGLADEISEDARRIGAANTLTRIGDRIRADNTDWLGVCRTLEAMGPWQGRRATVLGAGGAARAVVFALLELGMEVTVSNRTPERARRLAQELGARTQAQPKAPDLLVNATPLGMDPNPGDTPCPSGRLAPETTVFDTVYRPLETRLLREARERGCRTQDGLDMLVHQAVEQLRLWSGRSADPVQLRGAAEEALRKGPEAPPPARGDERNRRT